MGKSILVIDDERAVRDAFELALDEQGYDVRSAEDGFTGLTAVEAERPDLVFLDLKMPQMDGVEVLRRIKAIDSSIPVYIVTAFQREFMNELKGATDEGLVFELAAKPLSAAQIQTIAKAELGH